MITQMFTPSWKLQAQENSLSVPNDSPLACDGSAVLYAPSTPAQKRRHGLRYGYKFVGEHKNNVTCLVSLHLDTHSTALYNRQNKVFRIRIIRTRATNSPAHIVELRMRPIPN